MLKSRVLLMALSLMIAAGRPYIRWRRIVHSNAGMSMQERLPRLERGFLEYDSARSSLELSSAAREPEKPEK